ncbi:MAG: radical SAM protein [bacterium]|nr:radical SAM protein [bacterium]
MLDRYNRKINYLRISVTDRCNQRCKYCMPDDDNNFIKVDKILSFEEIFVFTKKAVEFGITKVRLTGGEPLVRKNILTLVKMIAGIEGINDLSMTTNGVFLKEYAYGLKQAGLHRLNVSLDTLDSDIYKSITKCDNLNEVLEGLKAAKDVGFETIKINCVVTASSTEDQAQKVASYAKANGFNIRFIRMMDMENGKFWPVEGGEGGVCSTCNRLRLSSDGKIYPCLFSDNYYSIKEYGAEEALNKAVHHKPQSGDKGFNKFHILGG